MMVLQLHHICWCLASNSSAPQHAPGRARKAQQLPQARDAALLCCPHPHQAVRVLKRHFQPLGVAAGEADLRVCVQG